MTRLQALSQTKPPSTSHQIRTATDEDAGEATLFLYDVIDPYFGISAERFVRELTALKAKTVHVRINSPGGDVFEARAIATAIRLHDAKIIAHIDGMALSAASWIALAADEVEISDGAFYMIHRAWTFAYGNAEELLQVVSLLEKIDAELVREYAAESGTDESQITEWLDAETWFTADEAVEHGFADRKAAAFGEAENSWDLSIYAHVPQALLESAAPDAPAEPGIDWPQKREESQRLARAL